MRLVIAAALTAGALGAAEGNPLTQAVMARYGSAKQNLIESAAAMPEEAYSFRLTPGQRTFGEWIEHTAGGNYAFCSALSGAGKPNQPQSGASGKAALQSELQKSFDYCDAALAGMTDERALQAVSVGGKTVYPVNGMVGLVASLNEHYGNLVGYLRSKGITPPSTARATKK